MDLPRTCSVAQPAAVVLLPPVLVDGEADDWFEDCSLSEMLDDFRNLELYIVGSLSCVKYSLGMVRDGPACCNCLQMRLINEFRFESLG